MFDRDAGCRTLQDVPRSVPACGSPPRPLVAVAPADPAVHRVLAAAERGGARGPRVVRDPTVSGSSQDGTPLSAAVATRPWATTPTITTEGTRVERPRSTRSTRAPSGPNLQPTGSRSAVPPKAAPHCHDPMYVDYRSVAMQDPVELADAECGFSAPTPDSVEINDGRRGLSRQAGVADDPCARPRLRPPVRPARCSSPPASEDRPEAARPHARPAAGSALRRRTPGAAGRGDRRVCLRRGARRIASERRPRRRDRGRRRIHARRAACGQKLAGITHSVVAPTTTRSGDHGLQARTRQCSGV